MSQENNDDPSSSVSSSKEVRCSHFNSSRGTRFFQSANRGRGSGRDRPNGRLSKAFRGRGRLNSFNQCYRPQIENAHFPHYPEFPPPPRLFEENSKTGSRPPFYGFENAPNDIRFHPGDWKNGRFPHIRGRGRFYPNFFNRPKTPDAIANDTNIVDNKTVIIDDRLSATIDTVKKRLTERKLSETGNAPDLSAAEEEELFLKTSEKRRIMHSLKTSPKPTATKRSIKTSGSSKTKKSLPAPDKLRTDEIECQMWRKKILKQLFTLKIDKLRGLVNDPDLAKNYAPAFQTYLKQARKDISNELRNVAEESLKSNETNTEFNEDIFMGQLGKMLDSDVCIELENMKPQLRAVLSNILQEDLFSSNCDDDVSIQNISDVIIESNVKMEVISEIESDQICEDNDMLIPKMELTVDDNVDNNYDALSDQGEEHSDNDSSKCSSIDYLENASKRFKTDISEFPNYNSQESTDIQQETSFLKDVSCQTDGDFDINTLDDDYSLDGIISNLKKLDLQMHNIIQKKFQLYELLNFENRTMEEAESENRAVEEPVSENCIFSEDNQTTMENEPTIDVPIISPLEKKVCQTIPKECSVVLEPLHVKVFNIANLSEDEEIMFPPLQEDITSRPITNPASESSSTKTLSNDDNQKFIKNNLIGHRDSIISVHCQKNKIFAASLDGFLYIYNTNSTLLRKVRFSQLSIVCTIHIENFKTLYIASSDYKLRSYNFEKHENGFIKDELESTSLICCMHFEWKNIFLGTESGTIIKYNPKYREKSNEGMRVSAGPITCIKSTKEGPRKVLIIASGSTLTINDASTGLLLRVLHEVIDYIQCFVYHNDRIYCGTKGAGISVFQFQTGHIVSKYEGKNIVCMNFHKNILFAGTNDGKILFFKMDSNSNSPFFTMSGLGNELLCFRVTNTLDSV